MKPLHLTEFNLMVYKDYHVGLKFFSLTNMINNRVSDLTRSYIKKHPVFLKFIDKGATYI